MCNFPTCNKYWKQFVDSTRAQMAQGCHSLHCETGIFNNGCLHEMDTGCSMNDRRKWGEIRFTLCLVYRGHARGWMTQVASRKDHETNPYTRLLNDFFCFWFTRRRFSSLLQCYSNKMTKWGQKVLKNIHQNNPIAGRMHAKLSAAKFNFHRVFLGRSCY